MVDGRGTLSVSEFFIGRFILCESELHPPAFFHFLCYEPSLSILFPGKISS